MAQKRNGGELPHVQGEGQYREELPHFQGKKQWLCFAGAAVKRYPMSKVRSSGCEEIPHIQGKRNPNKTVDVARGHQRADSLKPQSQTASQSDHMDHSLV